MAQDKHWKHLYTGREALEPYRDYIGGATGGLDVQGKWKEEKVEEFPLGQLQASPVTPGRQHSIVNSIANAHDLA